jgi:hypothetical protein
LQIPFKNGGKNKNSFAKKTVFSLNCLGKANSVGALNFSCPHELKYDLWMKNLNKNQGRI